MQRKLISLSLIAFTGVIIFISCKKEYSCEGCADKNKPPIAIAGPYQVITLPTDSVLLDGRQSSDPDGMISEWLWTRISGPSSFNIIRPTDSITKVKALVVGTYQFELKVTDNDGLSATDTMRIVVDSVLRNHPPIANAGADQIITLPTNAVNLDGSASNDPENNITSYVWTKISGPSSFNIVNSNAVQTQLTTLLQGTYQLELKVTDALGLFSKDTMQVIVNATVSNNIPPVAIGGNDTTIQTNQTSCSPVPITMTLDGSNSYDPDGSISSYLWIGPNGIANPNSSSTTINGVFQGTISVILKVTDNKGAVGYDTIRISIIPANRPLIPAQLIPIGTLSQARSLISVGSAGDKILFAGGWRYPGGGTSRVDIYDVVTNSWSLAELSRNSRLGGVATLGTKIFFAGGLVDFQTGGDGIASSRIDIYDASNNLWSTAELSSARSRLQGAATHNKIVFAGSCFNCVTGSNCTNCGEGTGRVDIYDANLGTWSTAELSLPRQVGSGSAIGDKIYFAGGIYQNSSDDILASSRIDIYDTHFNTWSTAELNQSRGWLAGIAVGTKNYWAGGGNNTVEIKDAITQSQSLACLSQPNSWEYACSLNAAIQKNNKIVFFTEHEFQSNIVNDKFDIYDITTDSWSIGVLPVNIYGASVISVNNIIYLAGGFVNGILSNKVYKLEF